MSGKWKKRRHRATPKDSVMVRGLLTTDEVVKRAQHTYPWFDRVRFFVFVKLGIVSEPIFGYPGVNSDVGLNSPVALSRIFLALDHKNEPVNNIIELLPEYDFSPELLDLSRSEISWIEQTNSDPPFPMGLFRNLGDLAFGMFFAMFTMDKFAAYFVSQFYHPRDRVGQLSKYLVMRWQPWGEDKPDLEAASSLIRHMGDVRSRSLESILKDIEQAASTATRLRVDAMAWYEAIGGRERTADAGIDWIRQVGEGMLGWVPWRSLLNLLMFLSGFSYTISTLICFGVLIALEPVLRSVFQAEHSGNPVPAILWAVVACWWLWRDYRRVRGRGWLQPSVQHYVDSVLGLSIWYALAYWTLSLQGAEFNSTNLRPLDFIYFSVVTMTTTGFGDISAVSPATKFLVVTEVIIGVSYTLVVFGLLISRLSSSRGDTNRKHGSL